jgi:hypothetical protein
MQNVTFGPYLAAIDKILISAMQGKPFLTTTAPSCDCVTDKPLALALTHKKREKGDTARSLPRHLKKHRAPFLTHILQQSAANPLSMITEKRL